MLTDILREMTSMKEDALLIQFNADEYGWASYSEADAIICRSNTPNGPEWIFNTLGYINHQCVAITTERGDMEEVAKAALYQFGHKFENAERIGVTYKDKTFPRHLIPADHVFVRQSLDS